MAFSSQKNFVAAINGKTLYDVTKHFDYSKLSLEERKDVVKEMLEGENGEFFEQYFSEYFNSEVGQNDYLSEEVNVCAAIERMADYLLASNEVKEQEQKEKTQYVYHKRKESFDKALKRESSVEGITGEGEEKDNILHFLVANQKNQKIVKRVAFTHSDLGKDNEATAVLRDYANMIDVVTDEMKNGESDNNRYKLSKIKGSLKDDMNLSKEQLLGVFGDHFNPKESTKYDVSLFDLTNEKHLLGMMFKDSKGKKHFANGLLSIAPTEDLNDDFNLLLLELQGIIDKTDMTELETQALELLRKNVSVRGIATELNITHKKALCTVKTICKKIAKTYNKMKAEEI